MTETRNLTPDEMYDARNRLGLSIGELSEISGMNKRTISRMENKGKRYTPNAHITEVLLELESDNWRSIGGLADSLIAEAKKQKPQPP